RRKSYFFFNFSIFQFFFRKNNFQNSKNVFEKKPEFSDNQFIVSNKYTCYFNIKIRIDILYLISGNRELDNHTIRSLIFRADIFNITDYQKKDDYIIIILMESLWEYHQ